MIEVLVAALRTPTDPPGVRSIRSVRFDETTQLDLSPPRMRVEPAALLAASRYVSDDTAVALLADGVQEGRTTADRLAAALAQSMRLPRRRLLREVLGDVGAGALSAMERRYLVEVERAHLERDLDAAASGEVTVRVGWDRC